jgi:TonB family protein
MSVLAQQPSATTAPLSQPATPPHSTGLVVLKSVAPVYPINAQQSLRQGCVLLKIRISESGVAEDIAVVSGDPIFQQAAIDSIKKWRFQPFIENGKPVGVRTEIPVDFIISSQIMQTPQKSVSSASAAPGAPLSALPQRVRVSQGVSEGLILRKVAPLYPIEAKHNHVKGTVLLHAIIRKDGLIGSLTPVSGPPELVQSATDAVSLWRYRPYSLQGQPVEVETTIQVNYTLN